MTDQINNILTELYHQWSGEWPNHYTELPPSGSSRRYFRISGNDGRTAIGVYNADRKENEAFLSFSRSLRQAGVNVPEIYGEELAYGAYLQQDLGDETLYAKLTNERRDNGGAFTDSLKETYKSVLKALTVIQTRGTQAIDFDKCYPRAAFDRQSMMWDLQYFKYYFLKLSHIVFDEQALENDYNKLMDYLLEARHDYFLYRDFQSRNIMIVDGEPWFIDYQGGRRGALQYDVASLLYDAKADIPQGIRDELLAFYITELGKAIESSASTDKDTFDKKAFESHYYAYVLIRIMQAMGAYGYRGFFEQKAHFLKSIPFALANMSSIIDNHPLPIDVPELMRVLTSITTSEQLLSIASTTKLKVSVSSFSYKHGIPTDNSGNGGGFVFDCRALPNPGRYEKYKHLTGRDQEVIEFFAEHKDKMEEFLSPVKQIVAISVEKYVERGFTNLMINFGCTGGQHRSVYCAEQTAKWISENYDVEVTLKHWEH
ncbi:MAG: phosphotransferase [Bacteroidales bacterium]|nr:phosphotransferase [Bacteroidales bacterium]